MKARVLVPLALVAAFMLASCENFDPYSNLFKDMGLGQVSSSDLATKDSATITQEAYSSDGSVSESFIASLSGDENKENKKTVLDTLAKTYTNPESTPAQVQESAALAASIDIKTTETGGTIVNNVSNVISTISSGDSSKVTASDVIKSLFTTKDANGETVPLVTKDNAAELAAAFTAANSAYSALGSSLKADDSGKIAPSANIDPGTTAQMALISAVVAGIDPKQVSTDTGTTYADKGAVLLALADGSLDVSKLGDKAINVSASSGSPLGNILGAAGFDTTTFGNL
jgi:hypothetical protein